MTRTRVDSRPATCQPTSALRVSSSNWNGMKRKAKRKKVPLGVAEGDRKHETCPVCLEHPHNAVLLLCSSYDKGCRPFMCGTGRRHSNCFEQFTKVRTKATGDELEGATELACPLCRSQLKGWTVVEPVRQYLNRKKRSCMQDGCSFSGTFKAMCKHVRSEHPKAKPRAVDPVLEQKWKQLEDESEQQDVISTISSLMPGAVVLGDYVVDGRDYRRHGYGPYSFDRRRLAYFRSQVGRVHLGHRTPPRSSPAGMRLGLNHEQFILMLQFEF
ncbi:hypothetical protein ACMD2_14998 [Ananas comosus]|uniref:Uncharacterized protein n=1 Tax=Ananas comosus TaxID=4615 RepID=A0A199UUU9_ANACO|nr:hypothetical protein ACMD2_14998 [Ananas comosus]